MLDLGIQKNMGKDESDYNSKYLSQLEIGEKITGTIYIGELKKKEIKKTEVSEFYVILKDDKNKQKWLCGIVTSAYFDEDIAKIYGEKGGRVYELIDSMSNALNSTELNQIEKYSVVFDTFRETINKKVKQVTVEATKSSNPMAKTPNLKIIKAVQNDEENNVEPEIPEEPKKEETHIPMGDDPQAKVYIKEIKTELKARYNVPDPTYEDVVKWAGKMQVKWELSDNDILRIKAQAAREMKENK